MNDILRNIEILKDADLLLKRNKFVIKELQSVTFLEPFRLKKFTPEFLELPNFYWLWFITKTIQKKDTCFGRILLNIWTKPCQPHTTPSKMKLKMTPQNDHQKWLPKRPKKLPYKMTRQEDPPWSMHTKLKTVLKSSSSDIWSKSKINFFLQNECDSPNKFQMWISRLL